MDAIIIIIIIINTKGVCFRNTLTCVQCSEGFRRDPVHVTYFSITLVSDTAGSQKLARGAVDGH